jgi:hypothetical protein
MEKTTLDADVNIFVRQMKVTRNLDSDKNQDPFFTIYYFVQNKENWNKVEDKYRHDLFSKSIWKKKSKVINNGGKEVDFKETMEINISMDLVEENGTFKPVNDEIFFLVIHFEDKDFFGTDNIGRALIDVSLLLVDRENKINTKAIDFWFPIIYKNK